MAPIHADRRVGPCQESDEPGRPRMCAAASDLIAQHLSCRGLRAGQNAGRFCDPAVDRRIARAQSLQIADPRRADALWAKIDRALVDRAVTVSLVTPNATDFVSKRVGNYQFHPLWGLLIDQLWVR
jgi:peptide/nickel transport system substrate-binding protein